MDTGQNNRPCGRDCPGKSPAVESHLGNFCEDYVVGELEMFAQQDAPGLRHPFDHERPRHDGEAREVVVQVLFRKRHVFHGAGEFPGLKLYESIDPVPAHSGSYPEEIRQLCRKLPCRQTIAIHSCERCRVGGNRGSGPLCALARATARQAGAPCPVISRGPR